LSYVHRHFPGERVVFAYEAGPTGYGLYDQITASGYDCLVVAPSMIPTAPGQRVKTNRLDSKKISANLRGGQLKSIHVPTPLYRSLRHLVQLRDTFVRQAVGSQVRIKSMLLMEGIPFPDAQGRWTTQALGRLMHLSCPPVLRFKLDRLLDNLTFARQQVEKTTREIHLFCRADKELLFNTQLLMSVPGMGRIIIPALMARIGDWRLIENARQLSGFMGLVPCENSTGDDVNRGNITHTGDRRLRAKLIQAAWVAIRHDPELYDFYVRIYRRNPRPIAAQKAITAVANKLCKRIACVLMQQRPYVVRQINPTAKKEETAASQGMTRIPAESSAPSVA
jgi:transposase